MAIEKVFILNNTGVMDDGVLAHRLGLIPLKVDPREFQRKTHEDDATDLNTLVFKLNVACKHTQKPKGGISSNNNSTLNSDSHLAVKSNSLEWLAQGDQEERFPDGIRPVHEDILITKLRPGQAMELELHCEKGIGKDHAKFSPVGKEKTPLPLLFLPPSHSLSSVLAFFSYCQLSDIARDNNSKTYHRTGRRQIPTMLSSGRH